MKTIAIILTAIIILSSAIGFARDFPIIWGELTWDHSQLVHITVAPGSQAQPLSSANYFGPIEVDGTIRIQLWELDTDVDPPQPRPLANVPGDLIWLEIPDGVPCSSGTVADGPSDAEGWVTFSNHLEMGGANDPSGSPPFAYVSLAGITLLDQNDQVISPGIVVNSPDINGDLAVDLIDFALFASDYFGIYSYRSDFYWDGVINLIDFATFSQYYGNECP